MSIIAIRSPNSFSSSAILSSSYVPNLINLEFACITSSNCGNNTVPASIWGVYILWRPKIQNLFTVFSDNLSLAEKARSVEKMRSHEKKCKAKAKM